MMRLSIKCGSLLIHKFDGILKLYIVMPFHSFCGTYSYHRISLVNTKWQQICFLKLIFSKILFRVFKILIVHIFLMFMLKKMLYIITPKIITTKTQIKQYTCILYFYFSTSFING